MKNFIKRWFGARPSHKNKFKKESVAVARPLSDKDLEKIFRELRECDFAEFIRYMRSPWWIVGNNFLAGIFRGLGIVVGMTIVFAFLVWFLSQFVNFPLVGEYFQIILNILQQYLPKESS